MNFMQPRSWLQLELFDRHTLMTAKKYQAIALLNKGDRISNVLT